MRIEPLRDKAGVTFRDRDKVEPYLEALRQAGLEPALISPDLPGSLDGLDGLLVTGGKDVDPKRYGQEKHPKTDADAERDELEAALLRQALDADLPVLCICRGMQLFNVVHGGTLIQHVDNADAHRQPGVSDVHEVEVEPGTGLAAIVGGGSYRVNSRHHQAPGEVGAGLVVSARSTDGVIEGLERPDRRFAIAVQWHPEDRCSTNAKDKGLFDAFACAVREATATKIRGGSG